MHAAVRVEGRSEAIRLGRYGIRCPLALDRLHWDEASSEVVYIARPGHQDAHGKSVARWDILEFLARVLDHLPDPSQQLLRYWGWYRNAARGAGGASEASRAPRPARSPIPAMPRASAAASRGRS